MFAVVSSKSGNEVYLVPFVFTLEVKLDRRKW